MTRADSPMTGRSPSAWRGRSARVQNAGRKQSLFAKIGREIADHPAETTALVAMAVALSRLLHRRKSASPGRRRALLPLSIMAALCIIGLSACATERVISVKPGMESYGRDYPENFAAAGRKIALEQCAACHAIDQNSRSPQANAPPMNMLLSRYDANRLADDLIAGTWVGHDKMPRFDFNVIAADSLLAYLETLDKDRRDR